MNIKRIHADISGRVQGVGFRPTVARHAQALSLSGFVKNTPSGVTLEIQGPPEAIAEFMERLKSAPPPQARMDSIRTEDVPAIADTGRFEILASSRSGDLQAGLPPDLATCADCRAELFDPANRRHGYPFINCTNCGPRFTIIRELPYDRERTSMTTFSLCPECRREYGNPEDRRFDAQPNACPVCGPQVKLILSANGQKTTDNGQRTTDNGPRTTDNIQHPTPRNAGQAFNGQRATDNGQPRETRGKHPTLNGQHPIRETVQILKTGGILALKGLGGYHLCCDATCDEAVAQLRERKNRPTKSLAVMFASMEQICRCCEVSADEERELTSCAAPIVILKNKASSSLSRLISPDTRDIGAFLPYSPLHCLLLADISPLVMTSGNRAEEPIVMDEEQLPRILETIADAALIHNRPILRRCDDSVLKHANGQRLIFRRSRGFVPDSISLPLSGAPVLACGADLKNTIGVTRGNQAFLSQHIGDLEDYRAFQFFHEAIADLTNLLKVRPAIIAHDMHPDYHSTRFALSPEAGPGQRVAIQHHHAHIAACLAEHQLTGPVIGVALDGTGYGPDGTIWGGEFLIADFHGYRRAGHFKPYRMPGGEEAIRHPERMAFSMLLAEGLADASRLLPAVDANQRNMLTAMLGQNFNSPLTSSAGRLFDTVAALLGVGDAVSYEARGAIRLQNLADPQATGHYPFEIIGQDATVTSDILETGRPRLPSRSPEAKVGPVPEFRREGTPAPINGDPTPSLNKLLNPTDILPKNAPVASAEREDCLLVSFGPTLHALVTDIRAGAGRAGMAGKFHTTVAEAIVAVCRQIRTRTGLNHIALSGGVFQNDLLLEKVTKGLLREGFQVYSHHLVPPNDGGLALGQAAVALAGLRSEPQRSEPQRSEP